MKLGDLILCALIFGLTIFINADDIVTIENLITFAIIAVIIIVVLLVLYFDYSPLLNLALAKNRFYQTNDSEKYLQDINLFKEKNRLPAKSYKGYFAEAELYMYQGNFTLAIDTLLYCNKKDMEKKEQASLAILKNKIMMFMDQLPKPILEKDLIKAQQIDLPIDSKFDLNLIYCYASIKNNNLDKAKLILKQLEANINNEQPNSMVRTNEVNWLKSLIRLKANSSKEVYTEQYNILTYNNCYPYIMINYKHQNIFD